jgi:hypothetical protein
MDKKKKAIALSIARKNRAWLKRHAGRKGSYPSVYPKDLACGCAIVSVRLLKSLKLKGFKDVSIVGNSSHCFLILEDHVLDVTATQFSPFEDTPVLFMKMEDLQELCKSNRKNFWWEIETQVTTPREFLKWQKQVRWAEDQQIKPEHLKKVA